MSTVTNSAKQQLSAQSGAKTRTIRTKSAREAWGSFYLTVISGVCTCGAVPCRTSLGSSRTFVRQAASQTSGNKRGSFLQRKKIYCQDNNLVVVSHTCLQCR